MVPCIAPSHPGLDLTGAELREACVQDDILDLNFIDLNMGCPIDLVRPHTHGGHLQSHHFRRFSFQRDSLLHTSTASPHHLLLPLLRRALSIKLLMSAVPCTRGVVQICYKGMGSALLQRPKRFGQVVKAAAQTARNCCVTFKTRTGYYDRQRTAADILKEAGAWGAAAVTVHGRTRAQRYSKLADWTYVEHCAAMAAPGNVQVIYTPPLATASLRSYVLVVCCLHVNHEYSAI